MQPKSDIPYANLCVYCFLSLNLSFLVFVTVLQRKTRKTHQRVYQCIRDNYIL